jgi:guanylate kinase
MSAHLILMGPSTAGKSSLMRGLSECNNGTEKFTIDRTWTTRPKRPNEDDGENIFVDKTELEESQVNFLFRFRTFRTYEYAIATPEPLDQDEVRMRILMPVFAKRFQASVPEPTIFCSIKPIHADPAEIFRSRDGGMDENDIAARSARFIQDQNEAEQAADITFQNTEGIECAVLALSQEIRLYIFANYYS